MKVRFQLWRQDAAEWAAENPVLLKDEPGVEEDTGSWKFGDGHTAWNDLPYSSAGGSGAPGLSAYQVAVANGFVGTQLQWLASLQGEDGLDGLDGVDGDDSTVPGPPGPAGSGSRFNLEGQYGFVAASGDPADQKGQSTIAGFFLTRIWVPAGKPINGLWVPITTAGTRNANPAGSCLILYDDSGNLIDHTPIDDDLFTLPFDSGWRGGDLIGGEVAAEDTGRFVYVTALVKGYSTPPSCFYVSSFEWGSNFSFTPAGQQTHRRSMYNNGETQILESFDPASYGTVSGWTPLYGIS